MSRAWLKQQRIKHKMTQHDAAAKAGIERSTYTKAENGSAVSISTAKAISNVFGISWTLFFEEQCDESEKVLEKIS